MRLNVQVARVGGLKPPGQVRRTTQTCANVERPPCAACTGPESSAKLKPSPMAERTEPQSRLLPAPHSCCLPQLSADDSAAITRTFLKTLNPACSQHDPAVLLPEYLRFMKLKVQQPPGVIYAPSNAVDAVWHGLSLPSC